MLMAKVVCEVMGVSAGWLTKATKYLGNVGTRTHRQGVVYSSADIDRLIELRNSGWGR